MNWIALILLICLIIFGVGFLIADLFRTNSELKAGAAQKGKTRIKIIGGCGKDGRREPVVEVDFEMGTIVSIVGPTGSGKTALINDIELYANGNTPTKRKVLINGVSPSDEFSGDPSHNPIALITQHTNFLSDLPVEKFLSMHAKIRQGDAGEPIVQDTLNFANQLTGESINPNVKMTELSGGQTRALLIADAVVIGNSSILLLDEIENAGINRTKALDMLKNYEKIFIFVTHDPRIALLSDFRIVMKNGAMREIIKTDEQEREVFEEIRKIDDLILDFRQKIREGERIAKYELDERIDALKVG